MLYPCQLLSDLFNVGSLSVSPQSLNCLVRLLFGLLIWLLGHPNERTVIMRVLQGFQTRTALSPSYLAYDQSCSY
jgi:hypothetical protein